MNAGESDWDDAGSAPVSTDAYAIAIDFVEALPLTYPAPEPEVSVDPDGWYLFEWYRGPTRQLLVSVNPAYKVHFSGNADGKLTTDWAPFFDEMPGILVTCLDEIFLN